MTIPRLVFAGTTSGVGKTTLVAGLLAALRARGIAVAPFKVGPDYIDPSYHAAAAGRPCRNLDSWLLPNDVLRRVFARGVTDAEIAIIEGVMGLFDGRLGAGEEGSTAQVAKLLRAPVVLVLDVGKTSRSAGAMAIGFQRFDPLLTVAGFILNRVGSERHRQWTARAIEDATGLPVLGAVPKSAELTLPERHLGLIPTAESPLSPHYLERLAGIVRDHCDIDRLLQIAAAAPRLALAAEPAGPAQRRVRIAVARDRAFNFYYPDSLVELEYAGAELVPFSPLQDDRLPEGIGGCLIGGGFPELFAAQLAANQRLRDELRTAILKGMPVYAECGGLMYLCTALIDAEGNRHPMVGVVPAESVLDRRRVIVGYREATALRDTPLTTAGTTVRGHEFHLSRLSRPLPVASAAYALTEQGQDEKASPRTEGYASGNLFASYLHLHFAAHPALARQFVQACATWSGIRSSSHIDR